MVQFQYSIPCVNYVRCHQFTKIKSEILPVLKKKGFNLYNENVEIIIKNALKTCISDSRMNFWFYDLFGLDKTTKKDIELQQRIIRYFCYGFPMFVFWSAMGINFLFYIFTGKAG